MTDIDQELLLDQEDIEKLDDSNDLTTRQYMAIYALLSKPTIVEAARQCDVPERTMHRWLKVQAFQLVLHEAESLLIDQATRNLIKEVKSNQKIMKEIRDNPNTKKEDAIRLRAATALDNSLLQWRKLRIDEKWIRPAMTRLEQLEMLIRDDET
ncbi:MAG: hypothetical protein AAF629_01255 [Chloroflexota bacterium]